MLKILEKSSLFSELSDAELREVSLFIKPFEVKKNERFFSQGEKGDELYIVDNGSVELFISLNSGSLKKIKTLSDGDCFGEMSIFADGARSATAVAAKTTSGLIVAGEIFSLIRLIKRPGYATVLRKLLVNAANSLREMTNLLSDSKSSLLQTIKQMPTDSVEDSDIDGRRKSSEEISPENMQKFHLFKDLQINDLQTMLSRMSVIDLKKRELLFSEGTEGDCCYIVVSGAVQIIGTVRVGENATHNKVAFIPPGRPFGHLSFFDHSKRSASAIAAENTKLLEFKRADFERLINEGSNEGFLLLYALLDDLVEAMKSTNRRLQFATSQPSMILKS
jgi:CRP-like cAMP-binding protein